MIDHLLENVSIIKLVTGEILVGLCMGVNEEFIQFAFPYDVTDRDVKIYNILSKTRMYLFAHKDIVHFKEAKDEFKKIYQEMVTGTEPEELSNFLNKINSVKIPNGCYLHEGNNTIH